jgi:fructosamine-3-kinase
MSFQQRAESILDTGITRTSRLSGGMIGQVTQVETSDGRTLVVKHSDDSDDTLDIEGRMLNYLNEHSNLPVPDVLHSEPDLLIMTYIESSGSITSDVQEHAAELLADLHSITADSFGLEFDTLIGSLHQPNPQTDSWIDFFREQRLIYMADVAHDAGRLPGEVRRSVDQLAARLDDILYEPEQPALIHGDMWGGNVLPDNGRIAGFVDPAIYYAHPEIELAFSTLFGTYGTPFFKRYEDIRPLEPDFFEERRDIYNLYPLLVHVRLFGSSYVGQVKRILSRYA